ncbi:MAG: U32 family peptidase, partial [Planctomycetales bacterium]|nr:U32 family peptidase [Planctomycetales bacterium]
MSNDPRLPRPELLAPAGNRDCVRAAVENGADAVYFGLEAGFNARVRAANLSLNEVGEVMSYLHRRGLRGYVTFNTLVFTEELEAAEQSIRHLAASGVDALLVQDMGLARLIRQIEPDLEVHASTQMTLTSAECLAAAEDLGIARVVLPRECSIDEIREIHDHSRLELEAFVHGALCVAYSGQCLTSESLGGRSANRGHCAQACRLPYDLICDGQDVPLGDVKYLLSPQDLAAFELIPELIKAGVSSLKIEGRLKSPEYVANITSHYRRAIDQAIEQQRVALSRAQVRDMELSFSRGFSPGWLNGCDHKMLVPGLSSAKRGIRLGEVVTITRSRVTVRLDAPIARGDGVVFAGDRVAGDEQGGRVYQVFREQ